MFFNTERSLSDLFKVTGANKGIGFGIVTKLCSYSDLIVYLTGKRKLLIEMKRKALLIDLVRNRVLSFFSS